MESVIKFETPHTALIIGPTSSGKSTFIFKAITNANGIFKIPPKRIYYCYGVYQPLFDDIKRCVDNIEFVEGIPSTELLQTWATDEPDCKLLIMDDLLQQGSKSKDVVDIYCKYSHHYNYIAWFVTQNVFSASKEFRTISLNAHYLVLFKNQRDEQQIHTLGRQIFPAQLKYFMDAYRKATSEKYNFLLIDLSPHSDPQYKLRTHIFPEQLMIVYRPERTT